MCMYMSVVTFNIFLCSLPCTLLVGVLEALILVSAFILAFRYPQIKLLVSSFHPLLSNSLSFPVQVKLGFLCVFTVCVRAGPCPSP